MQREAADDEPEYTFTVEFRSHADLTEEEQAEADLVIAEETGPAPPARRRRWRWPT